MRSIEQSIKEFLDILNTREESPNGSQFAPVKISSCRVALSDRLDEVLKEFEAYGDYDKKTSDT